MAEAATATTAAATGTTAAETTTAATTAAATTAAPWHQGIDSEIVGHWQNKGWKLDDPKTVAIEATKAARAAQQFVGLPESQLLKLPKDATDEAGWKAVYGRLGVPNEPKEYDFAGIKRANGADLEAPLADVMRTALLAGRVPKDRAGDVVKAVVKHLDGVETESAATKTAKLAEEKAALAKNWGPNEVANKFIASQAAQKLGIAPETVTALENVIGYAKIMDMFHQIGMKIGEDKWVGGERPNGGIMTRDAAQARKSELMADKAWVVRHNSGGAPERREMRALNVIISGDDGSAYAA